MTPKDYGEPTHPGPVVDKILECRLAITEGEPK